jgi:hypothetical protein
MKTYYERIKELGEFDWCVEHAKKDAWHAQQKLLIAEAKLTAKERDALMVKLKSEVRQWRSPEAVVHCNAVDKIAAEWQIDLRAEYSVGDICYNHAYSLAWAAAHSDGYDEVANKLGDYIQFLLDVECETKIKFTHR